MNVFDFVKSIHYDKVDLFEDPQAEKEYIPHIVNMAMSQHIDTVFYAVEMNIHYNMPKRQQFQFYLNAVPKKKRYAPWLKKDVSDDVSLVSEAYKYSKEKALVALSLLTEQQLQALRDKMSKGGRNDDKCGTV